MSNDYNAKFSECYSRFAGRLTRYIELHLKNRDTAEEIMQELFVQLYEKKIVLDVTIPTTTSFLYTAARHRVIDYHRKHLSMILSPEVIEEIVPDESFFSRIDDFCCEGEVTGTLYDTLRQMPEINRQAIIRRVCSGHKIRRISRDLNITQYRVNLAVRDARIILKESLAKYYTEP